MTQFSSLSDFLSSAAPKLKKGPVALIFAEDTTALDETIRHHLSLGFRDIVVFALPEFAIDAGLQADIIRVDYNSLTPTALETAVNAVMRATGDIWLYYCFNAEFLLFPFCEDRSVAEMIAFTMEERRKSVLTYVVDLYADDLTQHPNGVSLDQAYLDRSGYYALPRKDREGNDLDRQMDFFGGLRWRFEEHVPYKRRRIDRIGLFRNRTDLTFRADHSFNLPEYNTYACQWHHNITAAICSFRTAKALKRNPGSAFAIESFKWHNSVPFNWTSQQLLELGLMEPGQWF